MGRGAERPSGLTKDDVKIYSVSTTIKSLSSRAYGSIMGGTYIYIKVFGID